LQRGQDGCGGRGDPGTEAARVRRQVCRYGQTGIIVEGDGYPIDCMVGDFISGPPNNWCWTTSITISF